MRIFPPLLKKNLKPGSQLKKEIVLFALTNKPIKIDEKCFLLHLKNSFGFHDI